MHVIHIDEQYGAGNKLYWISQTSKFCVFKLYRKGRGQALSKGHRQRSGSFSNLYDFVWDPLVMKTIQYNKRENTL